jgi:O-antigen/teichoic acid export membrane protein
MIKNYLGLDEVGIYGIAYRISSIVGLAMAGIQSALTPLIYNHYKDSDTPRQLADIFRMFILSALIIFMALSLFSPEIIRLMTTPDYYSADGIVMIMVPAVILSQMYIFAPGIDISKKTYLVFIINFSGALLNIMLNFMLIPSLGIKGAALAKVVGYGCIFCSYIYFSQKLYKIPHRWMPMIATVLSVVFIAIICHSLQFNVIFRILIVATVPVFSISYGLISKKELLIIYDHIKK